MFHNTIQVTGTAVNGEGHALLHVKNMGLYIIEGLPYWQDNWLNKQITAIGDLRYNSSTNRSIIERPVLQLITTNETENILHTE
ncbi:MAG: hypothetical protein QM687_06275 [Ferruginibacter sp.]